MAAYLIVDAVKIHNSEKYAEYISKVPETIEKFGGKYLARGGSIKVVSGDWQPSRLIIVEFASIDLLKSWLNSPEYKLVAPLREQAADTNAIMVEGC